MKIKGSTLLKNLKNKLTDNYILISYIDENIIYEENTKIKVKCIHCGKEKEYSAKTLCYKDLKCKCLNNKNKIEILRKKYKYNDIINYYYDKKTEKSYIEYKCSQCGKILKIRLDNFNKNNLLCNECFNINKTKEIQDILDNKFGHIYKILTIYSGYHKHLTVKCLKCGYEYQISPANIIAGRRCINCSISQSKACDKIEQFLNNHNIHFVKEFTFNDLIYKRHLRFDYAIIDNDNIKLLIEYNGKQHYINEKWGDEFELLQKRDNLKKDYCNKNNLNLLIIPYTEENNIENILTKYLLNK